MEWLQEEEKLRKFLGVQMNTFQIIIYLVTLLLGIWERKTLKPYKNAKLK